MRRKISKSTVDRLRPGKIIADSNPVGFVARRLASGAVTYGFRYRDKHGGRQRWIGLGLHGAITADQARKKALKVAAGLQDGSNPVSVAVQAAQRKQSAHNSVNEVLDNFLARHVRPNLRSAREIERTFTIYVRPKIGGKSIYDLKRGDIVDLLDTIEDSGAPVMADRVLAHLRTAFNWEAVRNEEFKPPIVKKMARTRPKERARTRILADDEIRDVWSALDQLGDTAPACFPAFVRVLLLTAARRAMASNMTFDEIEGHDWVVPGARNKGKLDHLVPLTDAVINLLGEKRKGFIFSSDGGKTPFSGFSKAKAALDAKVGEIRKAAGRKPVAPWVLHDLRRTARTLMSKAGVSPDHAERVLAHTIGGVRGVYDRHEFADEKRDALERLGALVGRILRPGASVVSFPKRRKVKARQAR